ncbi:hypothetical protein Trydic_g9122 [Trypoxylus dichotomus]
MNTMADAGKEERRQGGGGVIADVEQPATNRKEELKVMCALLLCIRYSLNPCLPSRQRRHRQGKASQLLQFIKPLRLDKELYVRIVLKKEVNKKKIRFKSENEELFWRKFPERLSPERLCRFELRMLQARSS